jgi:hypothetical protein
MLFNLHLTQLLLHKESPLNFLSGLNNNLNILIDYASATT